MLQRGTAPEPSNELHSNSLTIEPQSDSIPPAEEQGRMPSASEMLSGIVALMDILTAQDTQRDTRSDELMVQSRRNGSEVPPTTQVWEAVHASVGERSDHRRFGIEQEPPRDVSEDTGVILVPQESRMQPRMSPTHYRPYSASLVSSLSECSQYSQAPELPSPDHAEHFACAEPGCGMLLGEDSHYEHEAVTYCKTHYDQYARLCHGCFTEITQQFVEIFHGGQRDQLWHPECCESSHDPLAYSAYSSVDMIHKYWNVTFKNEFAEFLIFGYKITRESVQASVDQTNNLTLRVWSVMSAFEETCATSISNIIQHATTDRLEALSASSYFVLEIEGLFVALDKFSNSELKLVGQETRKL